MKMFALLCDTDPARPRREHLSADSLIRPGECSGPVGGPLRRRNPGGRSLALRSERLGAMGDTEVLESTGTEVVHLRVSAPPAVRSAARLTHP